MRFSLLRQWQLRFRRVLKSLTGCLRCGEEVLKFTVPMLYALAFIPSFVMGGVTGVMQAAAPLDYQLHDTYFIVAHFHYVIIGGVVFAILAATHFYWPKMFGKMLSEKLGKVTFAFFFIGFHMTFFIQHFLRINGNAAKSSDIFT